VNVSKRTLFLIAAALAATLCACEAKLFTSGDPAATPINIHVGDGNDNNDSHNQDDHHSDPTITQG
jgi:hypothetical protein